eukprot:SM000006S19470  [mRNA]  locus=s6:960709:967754:- [translate_table: standard]
MRRMGGFVPATLLLALQFLAFTWPIVGAGATELISIVNHDAGGVALSTLAALRFQGAQVAAGLAKEAEASEEEGQEAVEDGGVKRGGPRRGLLARFGRISDMDSFDHDYASKFELLPKESARSFLQRQERQERDNESLKLAERGDIDSTGRMDDVEVDELGSLADDSLTVNPFLWGKEASVKLRGMRPLQRRTRRPRRQVYLAELGQAQIIHSKRLLRRGRQDGDVQRRRLSRLRSPAGGHGSAASTASLAAAPVVSTDAALMSIEMGRAGEGVPQPSAPASPGAAGESEGGRAGLDAPLPTFTVDEAIAGQGFGLFQACLVGYTGVAWLADALEVILLSFIGPAARCEWGLSSSQEVLLTSLVFLGIFLGSYCWGLLADLKGRRVGFFATAAFTFAFGLVSAWSPSFWILLLCRMCVGFGLGGAPCVFNLCSEFLPPASRGFWLVFIEFFWTVGSVIEALLAWIIMPHLHWRVLVLVSSLPFLILLALYPWLPESPRYLLVRNDKEKAMQVLRWMAQVNGRPLPAGTSPAPELEGCYLQEETKRRQRVSSELARDAGDGIADTLTKAAAAKPVWKPCSPKQATMSSSSPTNQSVGRTLRRLFTPPLLRPTVLLFFVFFANGFTYYGLVLLTTQIVSTKGAGSPTQCATALQGRGLLDGLHLGGADMSGLVQWQDHVGNPAMGPCRRAGGRRRSLVDAEPNTTRRSAERSLEGGGQGEGADAECTADKRPRIGWKSYRDVLIASCAEVPGLVLALSTVDRFGRKATLMALLGAFAVVILPLAIPGLPEGLAVMVLFVARAFIMGSSSVIWVYSPELFPTPVRATGVGLASSGGRIGGFLCPFVAVGLVNDCRLALAVIVFSIVPAAAAGASYFFPPERLDHVLNDESGGEPKEAPASSDSEVVQLLSDGVR